MLTIIILIVTFIIAASLGAIVTPRIVTLSHDLRLYDLPDIRKVHKLPIPRLGGAAFLPLVIVAVTSVAAVSTRLEITPDILFKYGSAQHFIAYVAGAFMLYVLGIYDDVYGVGYKYKFVVQIIAAMLLCISGLWVASLDSIFNIVLIPYWIGMPLTILFVVYLTNAMNLIDGIDGLASGLASISFAVGAILCILTGDLLWAMLAVAYMGVLVAFFYYNVFGHKNKIFMGDAGSLTLGYTLSFVVLHFWQTHPVWNPALHNIGIVILSTLIIPMMDVVRVMMSRLRDGRNPFLPDKNHIHHKLMRAGLSGRKTMLTILIISVGFIVINYLVAGYLTQSLIIIIDIILYTVMHYAINYFIRKREKKEGIVWNREIKELK